MSYIKVKLFIDDGRWFMAMLPKNEVEILEKGLETGNLIEFKDVSNISSTIVKVERF